MSEFAPAETKGVEQRRAWRGMAYARSGQGKFAEAEALYRTCLASDPTDKVALAALDWIAKPRK